MKTTHTLIILLIAPLFLFAQTEYRKLSIGAGAGIIQSRGDLSHGQAKKLITGTADYFVTPYISGGLEVQAGSMSGQDYSSNRYFNNNFKALIGTARLYIGHFMDKYRGAMQGKTKLSRAFEGVFIGTGVGLIKSSQSEVYRQKNNPEFQGNNSDRDLFVPLSAGIDNSGFNKRVIAGIRYQYNFALGDNVDGYVMRGSPNDMFSSLTVSLKYRFGGIGLTN